MKITHTFLVEQSEDIDVDDAVGYSYFADIVVQDGQQADEYIERLRNGETCITVNSDQPRYEATYEVTH